MDKEFFLRKHKGVFRVDRTGEVRGWCASKLVMSGTDSQGKSIVRFFSDRKHGGRASSLKSALDWRDKASQSNIKFKAGSFTIKLLVVVMVVM